MGIVNLPSYGSDPATVNASNLDGKVDPLATEFNGGIDNDNIASDAAIAASKLNLATIAQVMAMSSKQFLWAKGADVASGTSITLGTDGNCFDITGTTSIQTITAKQAGSVVLLHFDSALTLVDDTGNLELQGSNLSVAAESEVILKCDGTDWHLVAYSNSRLTALTTHGDFLFRSTSALARLPGTSGLFVKSSGTAADPVMSFAFSQVKIVTSTFDLSTATGDITTNTTGLGFSPKAIICFASISSNAQFSMGAAGSDVAEKCLPIVSGSGVTATSALWDLRNGGTGTSVVKTFDADGWTETYTKGSSNSGTANLVYVVFG